MKAGRLVEGCRQWGLFIELQQRPEGMTSRQAYQFLIDNGVQSLDIRDDLGTIRKGAPAYGWTMPPAEPVGESPRGSKVYRYKLLKLDGLAPASAGSDPLVAEGGAHRGDKIEKISVPESPRQNPPGGMPGEARSALGRQPANLDATRGSPRDGHGSADYPCDSAENCPGAPARLPGTITREHGPEPRHDDVNPGEANTPEGPARGLRPSGLVSTKTPAVPGD